MFSPIEQAIADIAAGRAVVVVDDEDRENEGDLTVAAEMITPDIVNFMATHGRGLICLPLAAAVSRADIPSGRVIQAHIKYSQRSALAEPLLRSSAALVIDTTHSSVLYSRRASVAMPIGTGIDATPGA